MENGKLNDRKIRVTEKKYKNNLTPAAPTTALEKLEKVGQQAADTMKLFDIFGKPITLKFNNQEVYKSVIGAMITFSSLGLVVGYFLWSFLFFVQRKNPIYSSVSQSLTIPPPLDLKSFVLSNATYPQDMAAGYTIDTMDKNINVLADETYIKVSVNILRLNSDLSFTVIGKAKTVKCDAYGAFLAKIGGKDSTTYYSLFRMNQAVCFSLTEYDSLTSNSVQNIVLQGNDVTEGQTFIRLSIDTCQNTTTVKNCKSIDDIRNTIDKATFKYIFTQKDFLANDTVSIPLINSTAYIETRLARNFAKTTTIFTRENKLIDYYDVTKTSPDPTPFFSYSDSILNTFDYIDLPEFGKDSLLKFDIKVSTTTITFTRKYTSVREFFINVLSIVNTILIAGKGFGVFINGMIMKIELINKTFFMVKEVKEPEIAPVAENDSAKKKDETMAENDKTDRAIIEKIDPNKIKEENKKKKIKNKPKKKNKIEISPLDLDEFLDEEAKKNIMVSKIPVVKEEKQEEKEKLAENDQVNENEAEDDDKKKIEVDLDETKKIKESEEESKDKLENEKEKEKANQNPEKNEKEIENPEVNENPEDEEENLKYSSNGKIVNPFYNIRKKLYVSNKPKEFKKFKMSFLELILQMLPCSKTNVNLMNKKKIFDDCGGVIDSYFDIERQIQILREYEQLRTVVLSRNEYNLLKFLTTPKILVTEDSVDIKKSDKFTTSDSEINTSYQKFILNMNSLIDSPYLSLIEYNLLEIHKINAEHVPDKLKVPNKPVKKGQKKEKEKEVEMENKGENNKPSK